MRALGPFVLAGLLWGLALGLCAGYAAGAVVAGASWLYLFGDAPWPEWARPLVLGTALAVALAGVVAGLWLGLRLARRAEAAPDGETMRRRAWIAAAAAMLAILLGLVAVVLAGQRDARERDRLDLQRAFYETLRRESQRFTEITSSVVAAERALQIDCFTEGSRGGRHRLNWSLHAPAYNAILAEGSREAWLAPGGNMLRVTIDMGPAIRAYHDVVLGGGAVDVEVEESLRLELTLTPLLDDEDSAALPAEQRQNLAIGASDLTDRRTIRVALRFAIRDGEYRLLD
jgi:hypothetical protein